jgi:hypothetical protein
MRFPVELTHPNIDGVAVAASRTSLRVLEARGWKPPKPRKPRRKADSPSEPPTETPSPQEE